MPDATSPSPTNTDAELSAKPAERVGADIDYGRFLDCVHCGLCTAACPTYLELGNENDSPRGRIYLMRAVTNARMPLSGDVERHFDLCLDCRAWETACRPGVSTARRSSRFAWPWRSIAK